MVEPAPAKDLFNFFKPETFLDQEILIKAPWGVVSNMDGGSISDFALLADMADRKGWPIEVAFKDNLIDFIVSQKETELCSI